MNIKKRINARKLLLSYIYQHCFFSSMQKKGQKADVLVQEELPTTDIEKTQFSSGFLDAEFLAQVAAKKEAEERVDEFLMAKISEYVETLDIESDFEYFLTNFFDQWSQEEVDTEYVLKLGASLLRYKAELIEKVNHYAKTFDFEQMDILDQACLLLGYLEYKILQTPKELIINEMVELGKRYSDEGAPKLINGILHQLLTAEENV